MMRLERTLGGRRSLAHLGMPCRQMRDPQQGVQSCVSWYGMNVDRPYSTSSFCFTPYQNAFTLAQIPNIGNAPEARALSTSSAAQNLVDVLAREELEENESGNVEIPEALSDLKASLEEDWIIVDKDDSATIQLFSKHNDSKPQKVQVSFHCQDTIEQLDEPAEDEHLDDDDDDAGESDSPVRFTVTISKAGKTFVVQCLSEYGSTVIETVCTTTKTSPDVLHAQSGVVEKSQYQGPEYSELAEDLQDAIAEYLEEECSVNSDVATFVAMYSDYKEQLQYMQFLKHAQSIIA